MFIQPGPLSSRKALGEISNRRAFGAVSKTKTTATSQPLVIFSDSKAKTEAPKQSIAEPEYMAPGDDDLSDEDNLGEELDR